MRDQGHRHGLPCRRRVLEIILGQALRARIGIIPTLGLHERGKQDVLSVSIEQVEPNSGFIGPCRHSLRPVAIEHDLKCRCPLCCRIDGRQHRQAAFCVGPRLQERPRDRRILAALKRGRGTQQAFGNQDVVVACKIPCAICQRDRANRGGRARQVALSNPICEAERVGFVAAAFKEAAALHPSQFASDIGIEKIYRDGCRRVGDLAGDTADGFHHQPVADRQVARDAERHKGHGIFERHVPLAWPIGLGIFGVERRRLVSFSLYRVATDQRSNGGLDQALDLLGGYPLRRWRFIEKGRTPRDLSLEIVEQSLARLVGILG